MSDLPQENLEVIAGNTLRVEVTLCDLNEEIVPEATLTGATAQMQIRSRLFDETVLVNTTGIIFASTGMVAFAVSAEDTLSLLPEGKLKEVDVYGCKITFSDGSQMTVATGKLTTKKGVVR